MNRNSAKPKKTQPLMLVLKGLLIAATAVYPMFMVMLSGAGLIYNSESYGQELTRVGMLFILSGIIMTAAAILVLCRKNITSIIMSSAGVALCLAMLYKLVNHADAAGWQAHLTLTPVSSMYLERILPVILPFVLNVLIALIQFFSYEESQKRLQRKKEREEKENAPAPPIV